MKQRFPFIIPLAVGLLTLGGISFLGWGTWHDEQERANDLLAGRKSPEADFDTSDWIDYRNDEFGFAIKYPPALAVYARTYSTEAVGGLSFSRLPGQDETDYIDPFEFTGRKFWRRDVPDPCGLPTFSGIQTETRIGDVDFVRREETNLHGKLPATIIYVGKYGDACYRLIYDRYIRRESSAPTTKQIGTEVKLFEQIVSTFTIID